MILEERVKEIQREVHKHMLDTRGSKYKWFIRAFKAYNLVTLDSERRNFMSAYYALMRFVDDVVDGDLPLPEGYVSREQFVEAKMQFAEIPLNPKDEVDYLLLYCMEQAAVFGEDFTGKTNDILKSMLFDAKRVGKGVIVPEDELI